MFEFELKNGIVLIVMCFEYVSTQRLKSDMSSTEYLVWVPVEFTMIRGLHLLDRKTLF